MQNITLGQFGSAILWLSAIIGGLLILYKYLKDAIKVMLEDEFKVINNKIDSIDEKVTNVDKATCKNFLVRCLADFEKGVRLSDVETQRFWEQYGHYIKDLDGNTYIREWTDRLKKEGKI